MAPESVEVPLPVDVFPPELSNVTAASFVPSLDEVMEFQAFVLPGEAVFSVHVAPSLWRSQMFPFPLKLESRGGDRSVLQCFRSVQERRRVWYRRSMR